MKCPGPGCGHVIVEKTAKFCSECGLKLHVQPANTQDKGDQPKSLVADSEGTAEKPASQKNSPPVDGKESNKSPKRPNDETISNPKKKKKKRKKNKKKKDDTLSSDQDQSHSGLSHVSLGDNQGKKTQGGRDSSDSDSSDNAMDETPDSLQDGPSSLESQPSSLAANITAAPPEDTQVIQSENTSATEEATTERQSEEAPGKPDEGESNAPKSTQDQTLKTAPADTLTQRPTSEDSKSTTSQPGSGKGTKATNPKDQTDRKNSKNKKETTATKQPTLDQNANMEPNAKQTGQTKQRGKSQQDQKQKQTAAAEQKMVFGCQTSSKADSTGSSEEQKMVFGCQTSSKADSTGAGPVCVSVRLHSCCSSLVQREAQLAGLSSCGGSIRCCKVECISLEPCLRCYLQEICDKSCQSFALHYERGCCCFDQGAKYF